MSHRDIVRAWKDPAYRASLSPEARAHMLPHPAGMPEITDNELREAAGATNNLTTAWFCTLYTYIQHRCCPN